MKNHILAAVILAAAAGSAQAQGFGFSGGEISAEALAYSDSGDIGKTAYSGALEFGITQHISVAVDLGFYGLQTLDLQFPVLHSPQSVQYPLVIDSPLL